MCTIRMRSKTRQFGTAVPNIFIDRYMNELDGSFIRVYLYLLRHYTGSNPERRDDAELSVSTMADRLGCMESDIHRALLSLKRLGLLDVSFDDNKRVNGIELVDLFGIPDASFDDDSYEDEPRRARATSAAHSEGKAVTGPVTAAAVRSSADAKELPASAASDNEETDETPDFEVMEKAFSVTNEIQDRFDRDPAYAGLTDLLEQLLGTQLSPDLYRLMLFTYDGLRFPRDLVVYLFDYCIELHKANANFMRKVAVNWAANGIASEEDAKRFVELYDSSVRAVRDQFGLHKSLGKGQLDFIRRWSREWAMPVDLIEEACRRTISNTGDPSFPYAEKILASWRDAGLTSLQEVRAADDKRPQKASAGRGARSTKQPTNAFNSGYEQREYTEEEYSALELAMRKRH
ncbi:MAG: DnaD domain protein [Lachnospiraceae bacterium]|nr:DnaD domain protein [Lachnospiraceae bacterium]